MKKGLSTEQILSIAKRKGYFETSPRWRDDKARQKCMRLCKEGLMFKAPKWWVEKRIGLKQDWGYSYWILCTNPQPTRN